MIKAGRSCAVWSLPWLMRSRIQMRQLTSTTQSKMSMISWSWPPPLLLWIVSTFQAQRSPTGRSRHGRPFPKDKNPLDEWPCGAVHLFPWLGLLARRVLAIPATSAAPERLFSTAGNVMTKKLSRLTCDNMEDLVYLHRFGCRCGSGRRSRRCTWSNFFWINETHYSQCLLLSLVCWLWDSIWMIVTLTLARCFSSVFFSLYTYTYTYTCCYYYCILYFLVLTKPAPAWVPVKASFSDTIVILCLFVCLFWHFTDTGPRTSVYHYEWIQSVSNFAAKN